MNARNPAAMADDFDRSIDLPTLREPERLDLIELSEGEPAPPRFIVPDWLPTGYTTLLSSHGAGGKSQIAAHIAASLAADLPWAGIAAAGRYRVLLVSCEDGRDVLHWRLSRYCTALGVTLRDLAGWLHVEDWTDVEALLYLGGDRLPHDRLTAAYLRLERIVREERIDVVILDNASDLYGGNEIARAEVRDFIARLNRLARVSDEGAVLLLGHVNREATKTGIAGQLYSGSTAWHNSVRNRWELAPERTRQASPDDPDDEQAAEDVPRILTCVKSNYGPAGASLTWRWNHNHHVLLPDPPASALESAIVRTADRKAIVRAVINCTDVLHAEVRAVESGASNPRAVLSRSRQLPAAYRKAPVSRLLRVLSELVTDGHLRAVEARTRGRRDVTTFRPTDEGRAWCA